MGEPQARCLNDTLHRTFPPCRASGRLPAAFESCFLHSIPIVGGAFKDDFDAYGVHAYLLS